MEFNSRQKRAIRNYLIDQQPFCYLCNEVFTNEKSITIDHMIPKSKSYKISEINIDFNFPNLGLAHYKCNNIKRTRSILIVVKELQNLKKQMGRKAFIQMVNWELK